MNLIDRDELELDTEWSDYYDGFTSYSQSQINGAVEVQAIPIPKGATNGDVIKAMFPNMQIDNECNGILYGYKTNDREMPMLGMNLDWWNAPYKKEVEE